VPQVATRRSLTAEDEGEYVTVLGSSIAQKRGVAVGDAISLQDHTFDAVGILEPTVSTPDVRISLPFSTVRTLPSLQRSCRRCSLIDDETTEAKQ